MVVPYCARTPGLLSARLAEVRPRRKGHYDLSKYLNARELPGYFRHSLPKYAQDEKGITTGASRVGIVPRYTGTHVKVSFLTLGCNYFLVLAELTLVFSLFISLFEYCS